jgi:hypothetical protein
VTHDLIRVFVVIAGVEQFRACACQGEIKPVIDGVQDDEIAQDVPLDGEQKRRGRRTPGA